MSMNRNDTSNAAETIGDSNTSKLTQFDEKIDNLTLKSVVATAAKQQCEKERSKENHSDSCKNMYDQIKMDVGQVLEDARSPAKQKQKRILGLKRHASPCLVGRPSDDLHYRTMHPKKIDVKSIVDSGRKKSKLVLLSKQEDMIKSQAQGQELTKRYQLLNTDLKKLLRSTSEGNGMSPSNSSDGGSPRRIAISSA